MDELKSKLAKGNYYSVLVVDGSTDKVMVEQETINILFLHSGVPKLKYSSVENVKSADTEGILQSLRIAFERTGIKNLEDSIVGLHVDRASVNTGRKRGLRNAPWLELVHCFNHRLEFALKDAFDNSPFGNIDSMLTKLYFLYQKSPKRYWELKELREAYNNTVPQPLKAGGTTGITMSLVLENCGVYISTGKS